MADDQGVYAAYFKTLWRARRYCISMSFAALLGATLIGLYALDDGTQAALIAARYVGYTALGMAVAGGAMDVVFELSRPPRGGRHRGDLAVDFCELVTGAVIASAIGIFVIALGIDVKVAVIAPLFMGAGGAVIAAIILFFWVTRDA